MKPEQTAIQTNVLSIAGSAALALIKLLAGIFGHSYALIADAIESAGDILASIAVWMGLRYAKRPADENHPYGHGKIEPLVTFGVVAFLVISATIIVHQSIEHIQTPHETPAGWTLYVLGAIILWKEISYRFVMRRSKITGSTSLKADAHHHRSDAITSVMAFVGISIALIMGEGYETADDWAALAAAGMIFYNSYLIFRPALAEVMDEHVYDELRATIKRTAVEVPGILGTEKCFIRKAGMYYHIDLHARVDGNLSVRDGHTLSHALKDHLAETHPELSHILIHIEPCETPTKEIDFNSSTAGKE